MVRKTEQNNSKTTTSLFENVGDISSQWSGLLLPLMSLLAPYKRIRISKSGKFCTWNQESGMLGFELRNTAQGTRNSSSPDKEPGSTTWNSESTTSESKTVLVPFNGGDTSRMTNIPGVQPREWTSGPFNADVRAYLNGRWKERHICVFFLLKHQWKQ